MTPIYTRRGIFRMAAPTRLAHCTTNALVSSLLKTAYLFSVLILSCSTNGFAQQQAFRSPAGTDYLLYTPPGYNSSTASFPLLISLHGKGEVGTDITKLSSKNPQQMPSRLIFQNKWPQNLPFIVLTPQQKPTREDPDPEWAAEYIDEVVQFVMQNYRIDATRVYLTGLSLGGTGCWTYAAAYPEKVAALVTLSGRSDPKKACLVKNIPIWNFHGDGDTVVPPFYSTSMITAINSCTPAGIYTPHLTILNAKAHDGWNEAYNGTNGYRIYEWLLKFKKNDLSNKTPYVSAGPDRKIEVQNSSLTLSGDYFDSDGTITNVQWTAVSGPAVTLNNPTEKSLILSNLKTGICVLELAVTDNDGAISRDQVSIEIIASTSALKVTGLFLVNGASNTDISALTEGMTINKYSLKLNEINIRATTTPDVLSTRFSISSDANTRTLNSTSPLYIKPQTTGPEWKIAAGEYVICATPFSKTNATGVQGVSKCVRINVTDGQACDGKGEITREVWNNITGTNISSIPVSTAPSSAGQLLSFESPSQTGDNYGAKVSGYVCPPASGSYVFYISSDANSELWLSTDENPANKVKIAFVTGTTGKLQWDKFPSQKSVPIALSGDRRYYIEALHKESTGSDHLAVGWQLPNLVLERPIPGSRLIPFRIVPNTPPNIIISSPLNNSSFSNPTTLKIVTKPTDQDGQVLYVEFFRNSVKIGQDNSTPFEFIWFDPVAGSSALTARATDNEGASKLSSPVNINVSYTTSAAGKLHESFGQDFSEMSIYPNPNKGEKIDLAFSGRQKGNEVKIKVMTIYGVEVLDSRILCAQPCNAVEFAFTNRLSAGLYLVTVDKNGKTYRRRILVE